MPHSLLKLKIRLKLKPETLLHSFTIAETLAMVQCQRKPLNINLPSRVTKLQVTAIDRAVLRSSEDKKPSIHLSFLP